MARSTSTISPTSDRRLNSKQAASIEPKSPKPTNMMSSHASSRGRSKLERMQESPFFTPPLELEAIKARTAELGFNMASERGIGNLLQVLAASKPGGRFLELGTGTGMATSWILSGMDDKSTLISVDNDEAAQAVAHEFLGKDPRL